jgi:hypothetical protein
MHHGITMSLYYRDPDDNGVELAIDNVAKSEWHDWMEHKLGENIMGGALDPDTSREGFTPMNRKPNCAASFRERNWIRRPSAA